MQAKVRVLAAQRNRMPSCCLYIGGAHDLRLPEPVKRMIVPRNYLESGECRLRTLAAFNKSV